MLTETEKAQRKNVVFQLRQKGFSQIDIARAMRLSITVINRTIAELRKQGELEKISLHSLAWRQSHGEPACQNPTVNEMSQELASPKKPAYLPREVAKILGIKPSAIRYLYYKGIIPCLRRGGQERGHVVILEEGVEAIRQWLTKKTQCVICKKKIPARTERRGPKKIVCDSSDCQKQRVQDFFKNPLDPGSLKVKWHQELRRSLIVSPIPSDDRWVGVVSAAKISGIKVSLLTYLARRRFFRLRFRKKKTSNGNRARLFAVSQMRILADVHSRHVQSNGKP